MTFRICLAIVLSTAFMSVSAGSDRLLHAASTLVELRIQPTALGAAGLTAAEAAQVENALVGSSQVQELQTARQAYWSASGWQGVVLISTLEGREMAIAKLPPDVQSAALQYLDARNAALESILAGIESPKASRIRHLASVGSSSAPLALLLSVESSTELVALEGALAKERHAEENGYPVDSVAKAVLAAARADADAVSASNAIATNGAAISDELRDTLSRLSAVLSN
ncbi:MAG: hypothetical protein AAGI53_11765 [Planctomycetota bacterium]